MKRREEENTTHYITLLIFTRAVSMHNIIISSIITLFPYNYSRIIGEYATVSTSHIGFAFVQNCTRNKFNKTDRLREHGGKLNNGIDHGRWGSTSFREVISRGTCPAVIIDHYVKNRSSEGKGKKERKKEDLGVDLQKIREQSDG